MQRNQNIAIFLGVTLLTFAILAISAWLRTPSAPTELKGGYLAQSTKERGVETLIPSQYILNTGLQIDQVPPITKPTFTTVGAADTYLNDLTTGISLEVDGAMTFYPVQVLNHHYVVMDSDANGPFAVTYCVFCRSGIVYNTDKQLRVSEFEYNNNVLLQDEDGNLWQQLTGVAVRGKATGETLEMRGGVHMATWEDWKENNPSGRVLSNETGFERDYARHPFGAYDDNDRIYYPLNFTETRVPKKWLVNGSVIDGQPYAFVHKIMAGFGVYQDKESATPLVAFYNAAPEVRAFNPTVNAEPAFIGRLTFTYDFDKREITDDQTKSTWSAEGRAMSGTLAGTQLTEYPSTQAMSMCYMAMHPNSIIPEVPDAPELQKDAEPEAEQN